MIANEEFPEGNAVATEATLIPDRMNFLFGQRDKIGINANGCHGGQAFHRIVQMTCLITQLSDFAFRVHPFQRRQVDHTQDHPQTLNFRRRFDTAFGKPTGSLNHSDLINGRRAKREMMV